MPTGPSASGTSNPSDEPNLFQLAIVLTENLNTLKCCVNAEKQARSMDPSNDEEVSTDEEEVDMPVSSVPLVSVSHTLQQLPATLDTMPTLPLETPKHTIEGAYTHFSCCHRHDCTCTPCPHAHHCTSL